MQRINCEEAKKIDIVEHLSILGFQPSKMRGNDYWYLSPLRQEKEASFKVNKSKNVWYDHGIAKGGNMIDFVTEYYHCNVSEALKKISLFHSQNIMKNIAGGPSVHLLQNSVRNEEDTGEPAIKIIAAKHPIADPNLCSYLFNSKAMADAVLDLAAGNHRLLFHSQLQDHWLRLAGHAAAGAADRRRSGQHRHLCVE